MANFRTTADILDGVLRRCGEITSAQGVSPWRDAALLYLNQIHTTLISGGNELNLDVDEPWVWARARQPIVIQLNPSIASGNVSVTQGSVAITFTSAPSVNGSAASVENWMLRCQGFPEIYRISSHTAGSVSATLDAPYPQETNAALSYALFQTDYDLITSSINISSQNDTFDFAEDAAGTRLSATVTHGGYSPATLATTIASALNTASILRNTYTGSYDSVQNLFTFVSGGQNGSIFTILGAGTNAYRSGWANVGLDYTTLSGALTYTSIYPLSSMVRLTQPARIYYGNSYGLNYGSNRTDGQIGSLDPVAFDQQYPMNSVNVGCPDFYTVIQEKQNGIKTVRFNKYLGTTQNMRVEFDHIPTPRDLYNNSASIPLIPRKFMRVLEFGASYYLMLDKEDSRAPNYLTISQAALAAMVKQNRRELERTGKNFGNVIARPDLMPSRFSRLNDYGYTVTGGAPASTSGVTTMIKVTKTFSDFLAGATTKTVTLETLAANRTLISIIIKPSIGFAGAGLATLTLDVGVNGVPAQFISGFDMLQSVSPSAQASTSLLYFPAVATDLTATITASGANLTALTAGSIDFFFQESVTA